MTDCHDVLPGFQSGKHVSRYQYNDSSSDNQISGIGDAANTELPKAQEILKAGKALENHVFSRALPVYKEFPGTGRASLAARHSMEGAKPFYINGRKERS